MSLLLEKFSSLPLCFGGASISGEGGGYGFGDISEDDAVSLLTHAFDLGIKVFDTAPIYGFGESERRIGKAFRSMREQVFLVSKSGVTWHDNKRVDMSNSPDVTLKMLEQSLRDLNSDYIDLYMIHWPDPLVDIRRPMEVLAKAKLQGKIKHIGLCNTQKNDLDLAKTIERIEVVQSEFNFFNQTAKDDLFPYLKEEEISFMSWGTFDKGILTGSVSKKREQAKNYDQSDCRRSAPWWKQKDILKKIDKMEEIIPLLKEAGLSPQEFALGLNLSFDEIQMVLVGMRNHQQLENTIKFVHNLPPFEKIDEVLKRL